MAPPGGQISYLSKWCHLVAKFLTNASGATCWPNFLRMQVAPPGGQIVAEFSTNACGAICILNLLAIKCLQLWCQPMGPLCLWQCLSTNISLLSFFVLGILSAISITRAGGVFFSAFCCLASCPALERWKKDGRVSKHGDGKRNSDELSDKKCKYNDDEDAGY